MNRDTAVMRVQQHLGFRTDKQTEIIDALKDAQQESERGPDLPWWLITEVANRNTVSGEERVPLPTNFIREVEGSALFYFDGANTEPSDVWTELKKDCEEFLRTDFPAVGTPCAYSTDKDYFRIFPTPDAVYNLKMRFYKQDELLTSNIENEWLKHEPFLLIGKAGQRIAASLRDATAIQIFQQQELEAFQRMLRETQARVDANFRYIMGGPD